MPANENALMQAVARQPVSAAIDASGPPFMFYSGHMWYKSRPWCHCGWIWNSRGWKQVLASEELMGAHGGEKRDTYAWRSLGILIAACVALPPRPLTQLWKNEGSFLYHLWIYKHL